MKSVILLSGPVGAGKTTVAKELIGCQSYPTAYIEGDSFWSHLVRPSAVPPNRQFKMIMMAMVAAAIPYALYGYETLLDFSIPPWFLETAEKMLQRKKVPVDYVVLRPAEPVCAARAAARGEGCIPDYGPYKDLYADFEQVPRRHVIVNDAMDAPAIAWQIRTGLNEGKFRLL